MNIINSYFVQIIMIVLLALAAFLGAQIGKTWNKYITTEVKQSVCKTAVRFVEQVYFDLHGRDKLILAMKKASELLAEKGIRISENELIAMLEAAVKEFNNNFNANAISASTAKE